MSFKDIRTERLSDLADFISKATPRMRDPTSGRLRESAVYRGMADASWPLLTSLDRLGTYSDPRASPHGKVHLERTLLKHFGRRVRAYMNQPVGRGWELRILAQHHGLPTRHLDWTYSPLVAAHFATADAKAGRDCVVWKLDWRAMHLALGVAPRALTVITIEEDPNLFERKLLGDGRALDVMGRLYAAQEGKLPHFAFLLEPPALHARVTAQGGVFTVCSDASRSFDAFLSEAGISKVLTRFVIPADALDRVRDQLDLANVTEGMLFPDLDGAAAEIRRWYDVSPPSEAD